MAAVSSFDVTSTVDLQEVDNAINQARKEIAQRYDFKGSTASIEFGQCVVELLTPRGVGCGFELAAQLGIGQPQRFRAPELFRVEVHLVARTACPFLFPFVHALLDAVLRVDKSFTCVCHHTPACLSSLSLPATTNRGSTGRTRC